MSNPVTLGNQEHRTLRVNPVPAAAAGEARNTSVVLSEFPNLILHYPILMTKNPQTGRFVCVAVFGFHEGENLFIEDGRWNALYIPLNIARQPFMIGRQEKPGEENDQSGDVVLIDMDDPRVQEHDGEPLFNERGFPTPYLDKMTSILKRLRDGHTETGAFMDRLLELELIAPARLEIEFVNREKHEINGLYTVDEEKLNGLPGGTIAELHAQGFLKPAYTMLASFGHIRSLIDKKNRRLQAS